MLQTIAHRQTATIAFALVLLISVQTITCVEYGAKCTDPANPETECDAQNTHLFCSRNQKCECLNMPDLESLIRIKITMEWDNEAKKCKSTGNSACSAEPFALAIEGLQIQLDKPIECVRGGECEKIGSYPSLSPKVGICSGGDAAVKYTSMVFLLGVMLMGFIGNKILC